ncbi:MAG: hypothetical protein ACRCYY_13310 [Trueperaceae bacterium]
MRWFFLLLFLLGFAHAAQIKIETDPADPKPRLEIRNVVLPNGTEVEYYVLKSTPAKITIDETTTIIGNHLEIDITNRLVRMIGYGSISTQDDGTTEGNDLVFDLEDETFTGRDVLISTADLDVIGVDANRIPGQINIQTGRFSPCTRCNQKIEDYGFRAKQIVLYPGDRLVAYEARLVIRDAPVLYFPVLVVPLAPLDRQPKLSINSGDASNRAEIFLDWPYVMGANAYGMVGVRYYADILPGEGGFLGNTILGGAPNTSYWGTYVNHQFITTTGDGNFLFDYTPEFSEDDPADFKVRFQYDTDPELNRFQTSILFNRDDTSIPNMADYKVSFRNTVSGVNMVFTTQGFTDLEPRDDNRQPSYGSPLYTYGEFEISPEADSFDLGFFTISNMLLKLGGFGDSSDQQTFEEDELVIISAGRIWEQHTLTLEPLNPWRGLEITGNTAFQGQYYSTEERAINWNTTLGAQQNFGTVSSLNLSFVRNTTEGESPFQFDSVSENRSIYLEGNFSLTPAPWLSFSTGTRYVFFNQRRSTNIGFDPLITQLTLFGNLSWLNLNFQHTYDSREASRDSKLTTTFRLGSPEPRLDGALTLTYIKDFIPEGRTPRDESEFTFEFRYGVTPYLTYRMAGGSYAEPPTDTGAIKPLEFSITAGTEDQQDYIPSFGIIYNYDFNETRLDEIGYRFTASAQPIELDVNQTFGIRINTGSDTNGDGIADTPETTSYQITDARYRVTWRNAVYFEGSGYAFMRPFELEASQTQNWSFRLEDDIPNEDVRFALSYSTTYYPEGYPDPSKQKVIGRWFENTTLEASAGLSDVSVFGVALDLDFLATWRLRDDILERGYLQNLGLTFFSDVNGWLGIQGSLGYQGTYDPTLDDLSLSSLTLTDVAVTFRVTPELYVSAVFNEAWDYTLDNPYNFQPEFRLIWDRCCWALYSSWDTATGEFTLTLTTPGQENEGFTQAFDSALKLPGRKEDDTTP